MKKAIVLLIAGLWAATCPRVVAAQELLAPPQGKAAPGKIPDLALPPLSESEYPDEESMGIPYDESWHFDEEQADQIEPYSMDEYSMFQCDPLVLESTGTWIRRGFWYAEVDAVISNRRWNRDAIPLILQLVGNSSNPFVNFPVANELRLNGSKPGAETTPRLTLGRFLFRDTQNRDHVGEFTIYGGGQWSQQASLNANPNNNLGSTQLQVPVEVDLGNTSFDGATSSQFRYDSRFNSFELNYHVKDRMGRDHMELEPSGQWVRRAGPTVSRSLLAGVRYFDLNEDFVWTASGIGANSMTGDLGEEGSVRTRTDNDMFGTQLGLSWTYETARWSAGARAKGGLFVNVINVRSSSVVPVDVDVDEVNDKALEADDVGFIGEAALIGKWHLRPNFSLRAGFELLYLTSTALAPHQISFVPGGPSAIVSSGDPVYLGGSIGFEGYW